MQADLRDTGNPPVTEQRIMRISQGSPIPGGWELVEWLGTETGILYGPGGKADVLLVASKDTRPPGSPPLTGISMDDYEIANLRAGLEVLRRIGCDTGDWLGQLLFKLPEVEQKPNCTLDDQLKRVRVPS